MYDTTLDEYSNMEIAEMGLPSPCECLNVYRDYDDLNVAYDVCEDCGASRRIERGTPQ